MKKLITFLLVLFTATAFSQGNYKADIEKALKDYSETLRVKNVDSMTAFIYPKFYTVFPKQNIIDGMKKTFADTNLTITFGNVAVTYISPVYEENKVKYVVLNYTNSIQLVLSAAIGNSAVLQNMKDTYEKAYGPANVKADFDKRSFDVKATNAMFAINDPVFGNRWWLLEKKDDMKTAVGDMIPAKAWEIK